MSFLECGSGVRQKETDACSARPHVVGAIAGIAARNRGLRGVRTGGRGRHGSGRRCQFARRGSHRDRDFGRWELRVVRWPVLDQADVQSRLGGVRSRCLVGVLDVDGVVLVDAELASLWILFEGFAPLDPGRHAEKGENIRGVVQPKLDRAGAFFAHFGTRGRPG